jgi:BolA protein
MKTSADADAGAGTGTHTALGTATATATGVDTGGRAERLRQCLQAAFAPLELSIEDESHMHAGHAGARGGQSHFRVRIVAEAFRGVPAVARHRQVYAALGDMLKTDIHALSIAASVPPD